MLKCSVLRGFPIGFGAPSGSISSGVPLISGDRLLEVGDRAIELPGRDVAVAAVAVHAAGCSDAARCPSRTSQSHPGSARDTRGGVRPR